MFMPKPMMSFHFIRLLMIIMTIKLRLIIINLSSCNKRALVTIIKALMTMPIVYRLSSDMAVLQRRWTIKAVVMVKGLHPRECRWRLVIVILGDGRMPFSFFLMLNMAVVVIYFGFCFMSFLGFILHGNCFHIITHLVVCFILPPWDWWFPRFLRREGWCINLWAKQLTVHTDWGLLPHIDLCIWLIASIYRLLM